MIRAGTEVTSEAADIASEPAEATSEAAEVMWEPAEVGSEAVEMTWEADKQAWSPDYVTSTHSNGSPVSPRIRPASRWKLSPASVTHRWCSGARPSVA